MYYDFVTPLYERLPETWEDFFNNSEVRSHLEGIQDEINEELEEKGCKLVPLPEDVFNAFRNCPKEYLKVVIWGQDPYINTYVHPKSGKSYPQAVGMSFSISRRNEDIPPSLRNIFKEIERSMLTRPEKERQRIPDFKTPGHGDLTAWARQGVLLLNRSLTTIEGVTRAHLGKFNPWEGFIVEVLKYIKKYDPIHVFWGRDAQDIKNLRGFSQDAITLESSHPSPLSVNSGATPFAGCDHFAKINRLIYKMREKANEEDKEYLNEIDWSL